MRRIEILGVGIDEVDLSEAVRTVADWLGDLAGGVRLGGHFGQKYIVTPNPEIVMQARGDEELRDILNQANLAIPDGWQLARTMSRRVGKPVERVAGVDLMDALCRRAAEKGWTIFLLGGRGGVGETLRKSLEAQYTDIKIAGTYEGDASSSGDDDIRSQILAVKKIDLLFVAYGAPKQEKWIARNLSKLPNVKVAMTVGGSFDTLSGRVKRAPAWMRMRGLEWVLRVVQQPQRIFRIWRVFLFMLVAWREQVGAKR